MFTSVEVNVAEALPSRIWIGSSKENGFWQSVEYEGNVSYCTGCGLIGHTVGDCRKCMKRQSNPPPMDPQLIQKHVNGEVHKANKRMGQANKIL